MKTIEEKLKDSALSEIYTGGAEDGVQKFKRDLTQAEQSQLSQIQTDHAEELRISKIKENAGDIILAQYPVWKQNNLTAQAVEAILNAFIELPDDVFSQVQKQALTDSIIGLGAWEWVKQIRAESDRLEGIPDATEDDGDWEV